MAGSARRQRRHSWQLRQRGFCKLQTLKGPGGFESHPLRHPPSRVRPGFPLRRALLARWPRVAATLGAVLFGRLTHPRRIVGTGNNACRFRHRSGLAIVGARVSMSFAVEPQ